MRKSTRIVKRLLALFLVVLMSIESIGAVVSDNDGSAFITKAEFDSLKNNFQSQIDQYNVSIDSKIDGAIASYLAGINVAKKTNKSILIKDWTTGYTMMNGIIGNDYTVYPNIDGNASLINAQKNSSCADNVVAQNFNQDGKIVACWFSFKYSNNHNTNKRVLVSNVDVSTSGINTDNMTWAGIALNANETWSVSSIQDWVNQKDPGYMNNANAQKLILCTFLNFDCPSNGIISSYTDTSNRLWCPTVRWAYQDNPPYFSYNNWGAGNIRATSALPSIEYKKDSSGNIYAYQHLGNYKANTAWEVTIKDSTNVVNNSVVTTNVDNRRTNSWCTLITNKSGYWHGNEVGYPGSSSWATGRTPFTNGVLLIAFRTQQEIDWTDNKSDGTTNAKKIPVLGLIPTAQVAQNIYQYDRLLDEEGNDIQRIKMQQGIPLFQVKTDEIVEWEPKFINIKVGTTNFTDVAILLSYSPFTDYMNVTDTSEYVKFDGKNKGDFFTTTNGTGKIKFEAEKDGIVYGKFIPLKLAGTDLDWATINGSTYWEATLDIKNCSTYVSTKK